MKLLNIKPKSKFKGRAGDYGGRLIRDMGSIRVFSLHFKARVTEVRLHKSSAACFNFRRLFRPGQPNSLVTQIQKCLNPPSVDLS